MAINPASSLPPLPYSGWLRACLPPAPARLLWVGEDRPGGTEPPPALAERAERLRDPDRFGERAAEAGRGEFAAVFVAALGAEADSLAVFPPAFDLLAPGGSLILAAPAIEQLALAALADVSRHDYFAAVAARHGFQLVAAESDATGAPPLLRFERADAPRWRLDRARPADEPELLRLFREVFGHDMSPALWRWKYGAGRGRGACARKDGAIVAHYGGMIRRIRLFGRPARAFQICDVMVAARERAVFTRSGPFFLTAAAFAEAAACAHAPFGYGFPNARVMRLAEKTGLYAEVGAMSEIRWDVTPGRPRLATRVRRVATPFRAPDRATIERLWARMAADLGDAVVGVRDIPYLEQRYLAHPHNQYELLLVTSRFTGAARGLMVVRAHDGVCELLDLVAPLVNIPVLVDQARRIAGRRGLRELYAWVSRHQAERFAATGGRVHALDVRIPTSVWIEGPPVEAVRDRWWLMSGDTDFR